MDNGQIVKDFILNSTRVSGCKGEERQLGVEWMKKFAESEHTLTICCQVLSSSADTDVKLQSIRLLKNEKLYRFIISILENSSNIQISNQSATDWKITLSQVLMDILSIVLKPLHGEGLPTDALFPNKMALVFIRQMVLDLTESDDHRLVELRAKIQQDRKTISHILVKLD
ncbi:hypothetical protein RF11_06720 [Thelohanellus kitauei]|uniref:Uncharacterized protein n=1 Tax=Thelohanellus kitauei TaxID=669202 RepID=A0A0C2MVT2_THEKT|nr:hypothetical protein RF11_06720 [Thelohanellus kitauei]